MLLLQLYFFRSFSYDHWGTNDEHRAVNKLEIFCQVRENISSSTIDASAYILRYYASVYKTGSLFKWVECSPMVREMWVQSQVESYQRLKKWYLIPPCLTLSNIRCVSRVKWTNPGKEVAPSPTPQCSSYWKGSLLVGLNYGHHQQLIYIEIIPFYAHVFLSSTKVGEEDNWGTGGLQHAGLRSTSRS